MRCASPRWPAGNCWKDCKGWALGIHSDLGAHRSLCEYTVIWVHTGPCVSTQLFGYTQVHVWVHSYPGAHRSACEYTVVRVHTGPCVSTQLIGCTHVCVWVRCKNMWAPCEFEELLPALWSHELGALPPAFKNISSFRPTMAFLPKVISRYVCLYLDKISTAQVFS